VDWLGGMLNVERGIVNQIVDDVKTETSRGPKTLDPELLVILKLWKAVSQFVSEEDWIFASASKLGRLPFSYTGFWPELQRAARIAGIGHLGTHAFRHTYIPVAAGRCGCFDCCTARTHEAFGHWHHDEHLRECRD
jgi:integrase